MIEYIIPFRKQKQYIEKRIYLINKIIQQYTYSLNIHSFENIKLLQINKMVKSMFLYHRLQHWSLWLCNHTWFQDTFSVKEFPWHWTTPSTFNLDVSLIWDSFNWDQTSTAPPPTTRGSTTIWRRPREFRKNPLNVEEVHHHPHTEYDSICWLKTRLLVRRQPQWLWKQANYKNWSVMFQIGNKLSCIMTSLQDVYCVIWRNSTALDCLVTKKYTALT